MLVVVAKIGIFEHKLTTEPADPPGPTIDKLVNPLGIDIITYPPAAHLPPPEKILLP